MRQRTEFVQNIKKTYSKKKSFLFRKKAASETIN